MASSACILKSPFLDIAKSLKTDMGWELHGYAIHRPPAATIAACDSFLDLYAVIERAKEKPIPNDVLGRGRELEERYEISMAEIIAPDRHMGIGWVTGGLYHTGSLHRLGHEKHVQIVVAAFEAFHDWLDEERPTFLAPGFIGGFQGVMAYTVAEHLDIPVYSIATLGDGGHHFWQRDRFENIPGIEHQYEDARQQLADRGTDHAATSNSGDIEPLGAGLNVESLNAEFRASIPAFMARGKTRVLARELTKMTIRHAKSRLRGFAKVGEVSLASKLQYRLQHHRNFRKEMRRAYLSNADLIGRPYVYYPLHYEPEATLNGIEPHFGNQTYAVELLSKAVPADTIVVIKEHPQGVGHRPRDWTDRVAAFPRVALVHPMEDSLSLIRNAMATVTIAGSAGFESILLGTPVICLGPSYKFGFLDEVFTSSCVENIRSHLRGLRANIDRPEPDRAAALRQSGDALRMALESTCFRLEQNVSRGDTTESSRAQMVANLLDVLERDGHLHGPNEAPAMPRAQEIRLA